MRAVVPARNQVDRRGVVIDALPVIGEDGRREGLRRLACRLVSRERTGERRAILTAVPSSVNATVTVRQPQLGRQRWAAGRWPGRFAGLAALFVGEPDSAAISAASVDMLPSLPRRRPRPDGESTCRSRVQSAAVPSVYLASRHNRAPVSTRK